MDVGTKDTSSGPRVGGDARIAEHVHGVPTLNQAPCQPRIDWGTDNVTAGQASERVATIELQISGMLRGRGRFCLRLERGKKRHKGEECMLRRACHDREEHVVPLYVADLAEWIPIRAEKVGQLTPMHRVRVGDVERLPQRLRLTRQMHHGPADVVHRRDINYGVDIGQRIDVRDDTELGTTLDDVPDQVFSIAYARP